MTKYIMGIDIGRDVDPTSILICEDEATPTQELRFGSGGVILEEGLIKRSLRLVFMEQIPLKTNYMDIARRIVEITNHSVVSGKLDIYVDATGVGRAVMDILHGFGVRALSVTVTGGDRESVKGDRLSVPKVAIIDSAISLLHQGRMSFAHGLKHADLLEKQLREFRMKRTATGRTTYENSRDAVHDDLVFALGLCSWAFLKRHGGVLTTVPGGPKIEGGKTNPFKWGKKWRKKAAY